jgi:hypothetical protein
VPNNRCDSDLQCGAGERCDLTAGECVPEGSCNFDSDCPPGQICNTATETCMIGKVP